MDDYRKIGIGLTAAGMLFFFLGIMLLFDKGLLAMGNDPPPPPPPLLLLPPLPRAGRHRCRRRRRRRRCRRCSRAAPQQNCAAELRRRIAHARLTPRVRAARRSSSSRASC